MSDIRIDPRSTVRRRAGTILTTLAALILVGSGVAKALGAPAVVRQLHAYGFTNTVLLVAALELTSGVLLLVPRTRSFGLLFASAFLGGAVATHVQHDPGFAMVPASAVLVLVWLGVWLEHPVTLWSF